MAEEFQIEIEVAGNFAPLREGLRKELDAIQKTTATLPVATTGPAGTATVTTPLPGGTIATAHATQASAAAQTAVNASLAQPPSLAAAVQAATQAAGISPGISPQLIQQAAVVVNPMQSAAAAAQFAPVAGGGVMGPDGVIHPERTFWSPEMWAEQMGAIAGPGEAAGGAAGGAGGGAAGMARMRMGGLFGAAYFTRAVGHLVTSQTRFDQEMRMAMGDPTAEIAAQIRHRHDVAGAFPGIGELVLGMRETATGDEGAIGLTLAESRRRDEDTSEMRRSSDFRLRLHESGDAAREYDQTRQSQLVSRQGYDRAMREITERQRADEERVATDIKAQQAKIDEAFETRLGVKEMEYKTRPRAEAWRDEQEKLLTQQQNDRISTIQKQYDQPRADAEAEFHRHNVEIMRQVRINDAVNFGEARENVFLMQNQPLSAALSRRFTQMNVDLARAPADNRLGIIAAGITGAGADVAGMLRNFGQQSNAMQASFAVTNKLLSRDPQGARIEELEGERRAALDEADKLPPILNRLARAGIGAVFDARERVLRQQFGDQDRERRRGLQDQTEINNLLADDKQFTARARSIQQETSAAFEDAYKRGATQGEKEDIIRQGISAEQAEKRRLELQMNAGMGMQVAPGSFAPGGGMSGSGVEPIIQGIQSMTTAINDMKGALNALIGSP